MDEAVTHRCADVITESKAEDVRGQVTSVVAGTDVARHRRLDVYGREMVGHHRAGVLQVNTSRQRPKLM